MLDDKIFIIANKVPAVKTLIPINRRLYRTNMINRGDRHANRVRLLPKALIITISISYHRIYLRFARKRWRNRRHKKTVDYRAPRCQSFQGLNCQICDVQFKVI